MVSCSVSLRISSVPKKVSFAPLILFISVCWWWLGWNPGIYLCQVCVKIYHKLQTKPFLRPLRDGRMSAKTGREGGGLWHFVPCLEDELAVLMTVFGREVSSFTHFSVLSCPHHLPLEASLVHEPLLSYVCPSPCHASPTPEGLLLLLLSLLFVPVPACWLPGDKQPSSLCPFAVFLLCHNSKTNGTIWPWN